MNDIQIFNNPQFGEVRVAISENNEPMFCLADVCKALELSNVSQVKVRLKECGVITNEVIDTLGRKQQATFINESNLYKCIFQSRTENAERFQDWVCDEVLPSIRKTGKYEVKSLTTAQILLAQAQQLVDMEQRQIAMENRVESIENRIRDNGFMSVMGYTNIHHLNIGKKAAQAIGRLAAKWCRRNGCKPEKIKHERWGEVNTYPESALKLSFLEFYPDIEF